ncbi:hypothetical protein [Celeribacter halophilus]|uniref:hypothetical protein n=1 Tax=Celeribacter halophilus TaxID=576117 RepID=UPI003A8D4B72
MATRIARHISIVLPANIGRMSLSPDMYKKPISNSLHAPCASPQTISAALTTGETELIDKLLDVCTQYQQAGDPQLSDLVDRIGMKLMQSFISRKKDEPRGA